MNEPSEVDMIIHQMRQSKMDAIRSELEKLVKDRESKDATISFAAKMSLVAIGSLFSITSNNAPLP